MLSMICLPVVVLAFSSLGNDPGRGVAFFRVIKGDQKHVHACEERRKWTVPNTRAITPRRYQGQASRQGPNNWVSPRKRVKRMKSVWGIPQANKLVGS